jgi:hypothetical protein
MPSDPFHVRVFGYRLLQVSVSHRRQFSGEAMWIPEEPPVWSVIAVSNGVSPVEMSFDGTGPDNAQIIGIEIPAGCAIRYELQPLGPKARNARTPGTKSRKMAGFEYLEWAEGGTFSFVDAADLP